MQTAEAFKQSNHDSTFQKNRSRSQASSINKLRAILIALVALCVLAVSAPPAFADESPCPATVDYFLMFYIDNGFGNWPFQQWVESSQLYAAEGTGATAECYYIGALYTSDPYVELVESKHPWHVTYSVLALQL